MLLRRRMMGGSGEIDYSKEYLTFEALEAGTFTLTIQATLQPTTLESVSYSIDGGSTWTTTNNVTDTEVVITTPSIPLGGKVLWKGIGVATSNLYSAQPSKFSSTGTFRVAGNLKSILFGDDFETGKKNVQMYAFASLFNGSNVVDAGNLFIPSWYDIVNTGTGNGYLQELFRGCSYLTTAPNLSNIAIITTSPFSNMFRSCTSLEYAPELPYPTLTGSAYSGMFNGCTSLKYIKMLATDISASNCLSNWVTNVASSGTFVKKAGVTIPSGNNGIPNNWTVIEV